MLGYAVLIGFLLCGILIIDGLMPQKTKLIRLWLGASAGLILMMWLPALYAFIFRFSVTAQLLGLATAALFALLSGLSSRKKHRNPRFSEMPPGILLLLLPFVLISGYLQYTHILRSVDGALHVGQSTYGDLCLHTGIATSLRGASFPPNYSILPGTLLGYPFLGDSMVTTMLLFGSDLSTAFVLTGTLMMALVYLGFALFSWELTQKTAATAVAVCLMFINGGLGFIYAFDGAWRDPTALSNVFTGFYLTPTNQPALNLRWVNVICDMMIPQRTLLCGWMALIPAMWMLLTASRDGDHHLFVILGIWSGSMPMIHTHSFLALGLLSLGALVSVVFRAGKGKKVKASLPYLVYGSIAVALALPQLMVWSFPQTLKGEALRFRFNWVNNQGDGRLIDGYCWFWIKNVGLIWLMMIPAALSGKRQRRSAADQLDQGDQTRLLGLGALFIYIIAETIQFQPNEYDNNKLFYVAYMAMIPAVGLYLTQIWSKLQSIRGRALLAFAFLTVSTLSGTLTIVREVLSDYQLFSTENVDAAQYIEVNTPMDAVILTGNQHNNPVAALAGRQIVCGTGSYLFYHGIDYSAQYLDECAMLEQPGDNIDKMDRYGVSYVYISDYERSDFDVDEKWFEDHWDLVFSEGNVNIYKRQAVHLNSAET